MFDTHIKTLHFSFVAKDTTNLAKWYQHVLGIKGVELLKKGRPPVYYLRTANGCEIEIHPFVENHIGIVVDDFEEAAKELESKGITLENVAITSGGWKIGFFRDPEGNLLELEHRPKGTPQV